MKLARKLAVLLLLGMMLVLCVDLGFSIRREVALFDTDMKRDHQILGGAVAEAAARTWQATGESSVRDLISQINTREKSLKAELVLLDDSARDHDFVGRLRRAGIVQEEVSGRERYPSLLTWVRIPRDGSTLAAIQLVETTEARHNYILSTVVRSVATAGGIALLSWGIAVLVGIGVVGRRVDELVHFARQIGTGDVNARVITRGNDELTELTMAMNGMAEQLEVARKSLLRAGDAKLQALEQLRHADRLATVGKLASGIAHELGTPLNVIGGRAKMILRAEGISEAAANNARIVVEQSARMADIIRQLLGFARAGEARKQSGDLRLVVEQAAHLLAPMAKKKSVEIVLGLPPEPVVVELDQGQVHQVLTNLLVNSIQASEGAGSVSVRLDHGVRPVDSQAGTERDCAVITVSDQGLGIPEAILPRIFEPFFTTKGVGEGTGLGLSVAWGIVQEHGGQIHAKNRDGGGAEFTVELPILARS